ncbi:MAG: ABC transporter ATP-binding protein [Methanobacteriaceae archaeon]|jgi:lipopolysaccharide transport system ATP-binding protein|nr:ABC transporter ATP-binding protein [Methanobacteriaceae archaeon]
MSKKDKDIKFKKSLKFEYKKEEKNLSDYNFDNNDFLNSKNEVHENNNVNQSQKISNQNIKKSKDIDELVSFFVPDYEDNIAIDLKNVNLTFTVTNDKIDNLKEYFIRTIKRTKENKKQIKALNNVSFKIYKGEKVGIIGFNGAGKSTLLKVISGVYDCDEGEVFTKGNIIPLLSLGAGFDYNFSGRENIFLNGAVLGYTEEFLKEKYDEILEFSELQEFIDIPVKNYSSGMLAKLGFSIATVVNPDILIIDEILSVGDINFRKKSTDKIKSLMGLDTTVLLVSHNINQIKEVCNKAIWVEKGKIVDFGEVNKVCDAYIKYSEKLRKQGHN